MKIKRLSQEALKVIACVTMLIDHIGAALVLPTNAALIDMYATAAWINVIMRCIGRISFPIFCFLLVEGAYHTHNPKKYGIRLFIGMVLSEIPFDLAFFGKIGWGHQSVMVTLLLGFIMIEAMKRTKGFWKLLWIIPFYCAADWLNTDYAGEGILLIAMFALVKNLKHETWARLVGMALLLWNNKGIFAWGLDFPIYYDRIRMLSAIPILCYDGRKLTHSKAVQWAFYLFYPVHITLLFVINLVWNRKI